jgi:acyl-homoserine lactone acylase PvdQ
MRIGSLLRGILLAFFLLCHSVSWGQAGELKRLKDRAQKVTIIRDNWGIPHIYAKTDADVVFGLLYAQCEDDFRRVEWNYIDAMGRTAEVEGESALYFDLRARMYNDTTRAKVLYTKSSPQMRKLMDGFADGVNYFIASHPNRKPLLLKRFKPWFPLLFSEGSIGGDLTNINVNQLKAFYENTKTPAEEINGPVEPKGSNGFAIAPAKTENGNALLLINPHTSFYFRSEVQMVSEEGLHAYGAVTWGQFFIYQGFNKDCGWMHTSTFADGVDEYLETVAKKGGDYYYKHDGKWKPLKKRTIPVDYKTGTGIKRKDFLVYESHHGPVIADADGKWKTISMMDDPVHALQQSYMRTKATGYDSYKKIMELNGNSSNNTVFADNKGNIAYWHGNFVPKRDPSVNWNLPVDGSLTSNDWNGLHGINDIVQLKNPANGWLQNCNSTPFTAAAENSPKKENYPPYMAPDGQNYRAVNADRVLRRESKFTLDKLIAAAYDPTLAAFDKLTPALVNAYESTTDTQLKDKLKEPMQVITSWNRQYGTASIGCALSISWERKLEKVAGSRIKPADMANNRGGQVFIIDMMIATTSAEEKLKAFSDAIDDLTRDFGTWNITWGEINRFQRLTGEVLEEVYDDAQPSLPVPFAPSFFGSLAAYGSRTYPGTKKFYGAVGNSFVAVVEFGSRIKAKSIVTGGSSSDPSSPHFKDQALMYTQGQFKDVLFYKEDVVKNAEKTYHPGE